MTNIQYTQSESGYDNCFNILFNLKAYIPKVFFEFDCKKEHYHQLIWSTHYDCIYSDIPFTMIYDEDYDIVLFSVAPENMQHKSMIAERIQQLVENESKKVDILKK